MLAMDDEQAVEADSIRTSTSGCFRSIPAAPTRGAGRCRRNVPPSIEVNAFAGGACSARRRSCRPTGRRNAPCTGEDVVEIAQRILVDLEEMTDARVQVRRSIISRLALASTTAVSTSRLSHSPSTFSSGSRSRSIARMFFANCRMKRLRSPALDGDFLEGLDDEFLRGTRTRGRRKKKGRNYI